MKNFKVLLLLLITTTVLPNNNPIFYYGIQIEGQGEESYPYIAITTKEHWEKEKSLVDSYTEEEELLLEPFLEEAKLCNSMESIYEACDYTTIDELKSNLLKAESQTGVAVFNQDFQDFITNEW